MLGFFKNLFSRQEENTNVFQQPAPAPLPKPMPGAPSHSPGAVAAPVRRPSPVQKVTSESGLIEIPLATVLSGLPLELKRFVRQTDVGDGTLSISMERVLAQIPTGGVKLTFGELRQAAPQLFVDNGTCDGAPVALPLGEILSRIDPALLARRKNQKHIEVPQEISSPFDERGQGLALATAPKAPEATPPPRAVTPKPAQAPHTAPPADLMAPFTRKPSLTPPSAKTNATPVAPIPAQNSIPGLRTASAPSPSKPIQPAAPISPATGRPLPMAPAGGKIPFNPPSSPAPAPAVKPPQPVSEPSAAIPVSSALLDFGASIGLTGQTKQPGAQPIRPAAAAQAKPSAPQETLTVPVQAATDAWPDALRQEVNRLNAGRANISIPLDLVEDGVKRGKVAFPWKAVRGWITPAVAHSASANDSVVVELPLKLIAPLFFAKKKDLLKPKQKVAIDEKIPNLFFGFPQPEATSTPAPSETPVEIPQPAPAHVAPPAATDTNYYVWGETSDSARVDETEFKRKPVVETNFLSRHATPNEVVTRAVALEGVVGALVALPDGLMVASKLPPDLNGDTLAAFLPQIFGKVSQCTKELRMGELNNLNFTVGNVPWKIFRVNAIFFAAFGRAGQALPTAQLATLAAQLDRKKQ